MSDQHKREGCAAGEGRQQEAAFAPLFNFPGAGFGEGDAGVGAQHGRSPPLGAFGARKKAHHIRGKSTDAVRPEKSICYEIFRSKNKQTYAVCLIIAPAMGLSRKIGGFLMAGASFFGDRSLYYTINLGDAHGSFSVKKEP